MKTYITLLTLIFSCQNLFAEIKLQSTYLRNRKVWGTYKQIKESSNKSKDDLSIFQSGDAIISKDGLILIKSLDEQTKSQVLVTTLPYKKSSSRSYEVNIKGREKEIKEFYAQSLRHLNVNVDYVSIKSLQCQTFSSGKMNCELSLSPVPAVALNE